YSERILALHTERKALTDDIAAVYEEAKNAGFVTKILRAIVREMQMESEERLSHYNLMDSYRHALGMLSDTPLGAAAIQRATVEKPRPFAEQPVHGRGRGRPRKDGTDKARNGGGDGGAISVDEALARSRAHLEGTE